MRRFAAALLILCGAGASMCATAPRTRVLVAYKGTAPTAVVAVEMVNATGHDLPMPPPGIVERAVRLVTGAPEAEPAIPDAFAHAAADGLAAKQIRVAASSSDRFRIALLDWDVRDGAASDAVVFVSADYQLLDARGELLWEVKQEGLPIRLGGPNLSRYEVARIASSCIDRALTSFPSPH